MTDVDNYIEKQKPLQKQLCNKLRKIILKTFPEIKEEMKMGVPWYDGKFYLVGLKDSVNLGFSVQGLEKQYADQLKGKGKYMRHLKFKSLEEIDEKNIVKLLKIVKEKTTSYSCK